MGRVKFGIKESKTHDEVLKNKISKSEKIYNSNLELG